MSIQSEIDRITQNVSDSYDAVEAKGGTMPLVQNSSNLASAIGSIPSAGVQSFNGRTGDVSPQSGDYTPAMIGAQSALTAGDGISIDNNVISATGGKIDTIKVNGVVQPIANKTVDIETAAVTIVRWS